MKLLVATNNKHKLAEFRRILGGYFDGIYSLSDVGIVCDAEETGETFRENAYIKAKAVFCEAERKLGRNAMAEYAVLADDSGLSVDALGGEPGVKSARYASVNGKDASDADNRKKLLMKMQGKENRKARFTSALVLLTEERAFFAEGHTEGTILAEEKGENGFGYDSLFLSDKLGKTFGEATDAEKDSVSHRAVATENLIEMFSDKKR